MKRLDTSFLFLLFCSLGVFFSYFIYGILQEKVTKSTYGHEKSPFNYFFSLLFFQCIVNALFAFVALRFVHEVEPQVPMKNYAFCGFTYVGAMFTSNASLKFVSYPSQVIGKSIKPIPIMMLNVLLAKSKYPLRRYIFVTMISLGVVLFMYKDNQSKTSTGFGELLLVVSLILDGFTGSVQEKMSKYSIGSYTLMFYMNMWSVLYLAVALLWSGEGVEFLRFVPNHPDVIPKMFAFGLSSAIGQLFLFTLVTNFGSLMCAIVTTTRKFFTVLASIILFSHSMSGRQWVGTVLVFTGLLLDQLFGKKRSQRANLQNAKDSNVKATIVDDKVINGMPVKRQKFGDQPSPDSVHPS